jgi:hypothetical protein
MKRKINDDCMLEDRDMRAGHCEPWECAACGWDRSEHKRRLEEIRSKRMMKYLKVGEKNDQS